MQLNANCLKVIALGAVSTFPLILDASEETRFALKQSHYNESDGRVAVHYTLLDIQQDFGTDYTANVSFSFDTVSGGTPIWVDTVSGASGKALADGKIAVWFGVDESTGEVTAAGGNASRNAFRYQNTQIDDERRAVSVNLVKRTPDRDEITTGFSYSAESDFVSKEGSLSYLYNLDPSRNRSITVGASYQRNDANHLLFNQWKDFNIVNAQIGYSHVIDKNTVGQINYFRTRQSGELSNPYQTIIRFIPTDGLYWRAVEKRPDEKNASGISTSLVSKLFGNTALHGEYRYYTDDWGMHSNTYTMTAHVTADENWTISPMLRYYTQGRVDFYKAHDSGEVFDELEYGSADERLGAWHGTTYGLGLERKLGEGFKLNLHAASQRQSNGLQMTWTALGIDYGF
ncbi:MAG: DUF3570 domain-containing protein [Magnetococcales bacterium]|nr:DUF3570 domain-containing protein [Magnetococcales bacterium]